MTMQTPKECVEDPEKRRPFFYVIYISILRDVFYIESEVVPKREKCVS
jgi:hypothetical protein